jgi:NitT/TauT family transport system ATP-binding protein
MTTRAGSIKAEIPIPLERPRQQSMMASSEFLGLRRGLMSQIREESLKAIGGEISGLGMRGLDIDLHGQSWRMYFQVVVTTRLRQTARQAAIGA